MIRNPQVIIIDPDHSRREELRKILAISGIAVAGVANYGVEAKTLSMETTPDIVMVAIAEPRARAFQTIEALAELKPDVPIVAYARQRESSPELMKGIMALGVRNFLIYPGSREEWIKAITSLITLEERRRGHIGQESTPFGSVVTVFGPKGGVGKTTTATNLAVALSHHVHMSVALVDLDIRFGDVAALLALPVEKSIIDVVQEGPINLESVRQCMVRHSTGVEVLPAPPWRGEWYPLSPDHVGAILEVLARGYDFVVVDCPSGFNDMISRALELSTVALLVTTPDVTGLKEAIAMLEILQSWNYPEQRIAVVINHTSPTTRASNGDVRNVLGLSPTCRVPFDKQVGRSLNEGRPVVMGKSPAAAAFRDLALSLSGQGEKGKGLWRRLLPQPLVVGR